MFGYIIERGTESLMNWCRKTGRVLHITGTGGPDDIYLIRYYLLKSKYLNIFIHQFLRSDRDDLHDHPWNFATFLVRGAYTEHKWNEKLGREELTRRTSGVNRLVFYRKHFCPAGGYWEKLMDSAQLLELKPQSRLVFRKATDQHKVMVDHSFTFEERRFAPLTICVTGPTIRTWGFIKMFYDQIAITQNAAIPIKVKELEDTVELTIPKMSGPVSVYRGPIRKWVDWREYLGLPPDSPGRG